MGIEIDQQKNNDANKLRKTEELIVCSLTLKAAILRDISQD